MQPKANKHLLAGLNRFQKMLLVAEGTVTELLEQYLGESIKVSKLCEEVQYDFSHLPHLHTELLTQEDIPVLERKILLQGQSTLRNWLYAESTIVLSHLTESFRNDLLLSREPIGKLWTKYQLETYKMILGAEEEKTGDLAPYFNIDADAAMISRTYRVYSGKKIIMIITEKFPKHFFRN